MQTVVDEESLARDILAFLRHHGFEVSERGGVVRALAEVPAEEDGVFFLASVLARLEPIKYECRWSSYTWTPDTESVEFVVKFRLAGKNWRIFIIFSRRVH